MQGVKGRGEDCKVSQCFLLLHKRDMKNSDVTGAEIGNISKDDNLPGKREIMSLLPT
jgi:hypothetical protein